MLPRDFDNTNVGYSSKHEPQDPFLTTSLLMAQLTHVYYYGTNLRLVGLARTSLRLRRFKKRLAHNATSLVLSLFFVVASTVFMPISLELVNSPPLVRPQVSKTVILTPTSLGLSQTILSIVYVYLIILSIMRSKSLALRYCVWF